MQDEIWVYLEVRAGQITSGAAEALGEGYSLAEARRVHLGAVMVQGEAGGGVTALDRFGVRTVYLLEHPLLNEYHSETYAGALIQAIQAYRPSLILAASSALTLDLLPRLAAGLPAPIIYDCTQVADREGCFEFTRPAYGGMASVVLTCSAPAPILATLLPGAVGAPALLPAFAPDIIRFTLDLDDVQIQTRRISLTPGDPTRFDLAEADVIVCGGRGAGEAQDWLLLQQLARNLGGALGGSRPALDAGHIARPRMIGQTGKSVKTRLYLAAGISGSPYHLRGVNTQHLLAINSDANAPIFKSCQFGICGDLRQVIPEFLKLGG